ncbi:MAG: response regulator transcription factor [Deinococcota bacterium]
MWETVRILVADDHSFFRDGIRLLINNTPDFELAGEVDTALDVVNFADKEQPDIILMDVKMPPSDGIEATRQITQNNPHINVLILTMFDDDKNVFNALQAGAKGYVLKGINQEELTRTIRLVAMGNAVYGSKIAEQMRSFFCRIKHHQTTHVFPDLTRRENHILNLVAEDMTNKSIAAECGIAEKTVRNHITSILAKLQVSNRTEAILRLKENSA